MPVKLSGALVNADLIARDLDVADGAARARQAADIAEAQRRLLIAQGGHDVPAERLRVHFPGVLASLKAAVAIVDLGLLLDNSDAHSPFRFVALFERGKRRCKARQTPDWAIEIV